MPEPIYLDYNATTPIRPEVIRVVADIMVAPHNASSVHSLGREAHRLIENARDKIGKFVNCPPAQIIFNSGATEGNNTVLKYFSNERILISAIEHPSVLEAVKSAERIPVTPDGIVDLAALETLLKQKKTGLVSVMLVNNETGAIQPIEKISALAHRHGALFHCDAVQAAGRMPMDMQLLGIDFLTLSAHKIGGPQGVGALCLALCGITPTLLDGGGQEKKARPGTQNTAGIFGFGLAAEMAQDELAAYLAHTRQLQSQLESALLKDNVTIHSASTPRVTNTTLFSAPGTQAETLLMALDLEGICISNGSACSSGSVKPSHVLEAMSVPASIAAGTLRVSTGWATTEADIEKFLTAWQKISTRINNNKKANA